VCDSRKFLDKDPLPKIFSLISSVHPTTSSVKISPQTRAKAVYCLSSSLKNWPGAADLLSNDSNRGWIILREGLRDPEMTIRRKIAFLLNALIVQSAETQVGEDGMKRMLASMRSNGIIDGLVSSLTDPLPVGADGDAEPDWDLQEKSFAALMSAARNDGLNGEDKTALVEVIKNWRGAKGGLDNVGLSESEADDALATLAA
jgi:hsp70-interacting protein